MTTLAHGRSFAASPSARIRRHNVTLLIPRVRRALAVSREVCGAALVLPRHVDGGPGDVFFTCLGVRPRCRCFRSCRRGCPGGHPQFTSATRTCREPFPVGIFIGKRNVPSPLPSKSQLALPLLCTTMRSRCPSHHLLPIPHRLWERFALWRRSRQSSHVQRTARTRWPAQARTRDAWPCAEFLERTKKRLACAWRSVPQRYRARQQAR